ncbi:MAG: DUF1697 domain-containing protein [Actinobacteria bacterium]|nr:DUF1697 domain-containing protein [Actinomycetota bacterium]
MDRAPAVSLFVVLLRGINVGGRNRLPMADLRSALTADGLDEVRTYIQSGNIVLGTPARSADVVGARVRAVIAREFGLDVPTIALSTSALAEIVADNPFPYETDHRRLHAIVLPQAPDASTLTWLAERQAVATAEDSDDRVTVIDRTAYLHTPGGFGTSALAASLISGRSPLVDGTARNWATVTTLLEMCAP